jgi:hypothetical protein
VIIHEAYNIVIPAKAGIHVDPGSQSKMDSGFRRNDGYFTI